MDFLSWWPHTLWFIDWVLFLVLGARILLKRQDVGVQLAWILLLAASPVIGTVVYLLVGELWLSRRRIRKSEDHMKKIYAHFKDLKPHIRESWPPERTLAEGMRRIGASTHVMSTIDGNKVELLHGAEPGFDRLLADIAEAESRIDMLYYIWFSAGRVDEVEVALMDAVKRGVTCRVLVDSSASKRWLNSEAAQRLRNAGVQVQEALPVHWYRVPAARIDLRNHRKLTVIDCKIAYSGSLNMADPKYFKVERNVGAWVDVVARIEGPVIAPLLGVFELDWSLESHSDPFAGNRKVDVCVPEIAGETPVQVVPSGPGLHPETLHQLLLQAVYGAREKLIISTPYFVPDEAMMAALAAAVARQVDVSLIVPFQNDSFMVKWASRAYFDDLLRAGVHIYRFEGGLLHAKTVTVDDQLAMLGTVNMDRRSFWINMELSMFVYDDNVTRQLREFQEDYIRNSVAMDLETWEKRSAAKRILENSVQLLSPVL